MPTFATANEKQRCHSSVGRAIPGGTTFTKRKIMKTAEIQSFQRFFLYVLSAKMYNLWINVKI